MVQKIIDFQIVTNQNENCQASKASQTIFSCAKRARRFSVVQSEPDDFQLCKASQTIFIHTLNLLKS
jgi:hypothetical protein